MVGRDQGWTLGLKKYGDGLHAYWTNSSILRDYRVQPSIEPRISHGFTKENILTESKLPV